MRLDYGKEGIEINYLVQPVKILGKNGKVVGLECIKMKLGKPDESGRRRSVPIKDSEFKIEVDTVMPAIGQSPEISSLKNLGLKVSKIGTIIVDENTYSTNTQVFLQQVMQYRVLPQLLQQ